MKKLKILHIITHLGVGGASDNTLLTVEGLSRSRYEVHTAAGGDYMDWVERGKEGSDKFFLFPKMKRSPSPIDDLRVLSRLTKLMRKQQYDIVHTHNAKAGILGRIAAKRVGVPLVLHTLHLLSWQDGLSEKTTRGQRMKALARSRFFLELERYAASLSDALITVCQMNKQEAIDEKLADASKFRNVYSGIDLERFQVEIDREAKCRSLGLEPTRPIIGTIGRLSDQKAPLDFVQAAKAVLRKKPEVQFIMVGDGPLAAEVEEAIGNEERIRVLGFRSDIPEIYAIMDVFALPSLWEGLGRALTEAMIMGVPVAATAVNGVPELVKHNETGLLSDPAKPFQLADNLLWLLSHTDEAKRLSHNAYDLVVPAFDANQMVDKLDALYVSMLAAKGAPLSTPQVGHELRQTGGSNA